MVGDSNDHAPKFERGTYTASLEESSEPGTSVLTVRATDKDDGENGRLRYSLRYGGKGIRHEMLEPMGLIGT